MEVIIREVKKQRAKLADVKTQEDLVRAIPYGIVIDSQSITYGKMSTYRLRQLINGSRIKDMEEVKLLSVLSDMPAVDIWDMLNLELWFTKTDLIQLKQFDEQID